jgi:predicted RNase H-like nuclease
MRTVLGIDAAWTLTQPSGLALVTETATGWRLLAVESSYQRFHACADDTMTPDVRPLGSKPQAQALMASCAALSGRSVDLVAIDMPLSHVPITGRRPCDNAVSRAYGARKCGTHSASAVRPGAISDTLSAAFGACGYPLRTVTIQTPGIIEVYPHPALVELSGATVRLPYKISRSAQYWPALDPGQRRLALYRQWANIVALLETRIDGVARALPGLEPGASGLAAKAYEDKIDAIVCAWVAIRALEGQAIRFGDEVSAIWIPAPLHPRIAIASDETRSGDLPDIP